MQHACKVPSVSLSFWQNETVVLFVIYLMLQRGMQRDHQKPACLGNISACAVAYPLQVYEALYRCQSQKINACILLDIKLTVRRSTT